MKCGSASEGRIERVIEDAEVAQLGRLLLGLFDRSQRWVRLSRVSWPVWFEPRSQTGFQLLLAAALMRSCSAGVNQRFQTNTATKPATIRATAANRKYSVGVTVYLDELAPSSTRPQGSLLSNCPGAVLAPVRDTWRQRMLADNQANCDKFSQESRAQHNRHRARHGRPGRRHNRTRRTSST